MNLLFFSVFLFFQTDSVFFKIQEQIELGNFAYADKLSVIALKKKNNEKIRFIRIKNILENYMIQKKFKNFILEDTEKVPLGRVIIQNIEKILSKKKSSPSYLFYAYQKYLYLQKFPSLRKIRTEQKILYQKILSARRSDLRFWMLYDINLKRGNYKIAFKFYKKISKKFKKKYKYEAFQYRTNNFTSSDTEKILLKELDKTNISETLRANLQLELSRLLLKTNDFERANYYFNHINSALLEPFEYELVKLKLEKSDFHLALINLFKKFKFDNKFYVFLEKNLKKQKKKKRISILQGMYKSEKEHYAKLHIAYLLYRQYKSMVSSKSRNKALKRYSDLCYVHLRKAQF